MYATTFKKLSFEKKAYLLNKFIRLKPGDPESFRGFKQVLSFMVGGMCLLQNPRYVSEDVLAGYETKTINEHTIPISVIVEYLLSNDAEYFSEEFLVDFLKKIAGIALISKKEDEKLNLNVRTSLPPGISIEDVLNGNATHSCRYDYAGIRYIENK